MRQPTAWLFEDGCDGGCNQDVKKGGSVPHGSAVSDEAKNHGFVSCRGYLPFVVVVTVTTMGRASSSTIEAVDHGLLEAGFFVFSFLGAKQGRLGSCKVRKR